MKNDNSNSDKTKSGKKKIAWLTIIAIAGAIAIFAFVVPLTMSDGTEKFTGKEKQAAELQLTAAPKLVDAMDRYVDMIIKYRVEAVYKTPINKVESWCGTHYDKNETYYSVVIGEYSFFGIKVGEFSRHDTCLLLNG